MSKAKTVAEPQNTKAIPFKILFIGDAGVGKSQHLKVEIEKFGARDIPNKNTIEYSYVSPKEKYKVSVVHNCGKDYKDTKLAVLCLSFIDRQSKENLKNVWYREVKKYLPDVPIAIFAFKNDLTNKEDSIEPVNRAHITRVELSALREQLQACSFHEFDLYQIDLAANCVAIVEETKAVRTVGNTTIRRKSILNSVRKIIAPCTSAGENIDEDDIKGCCPISKIVRKSVNGSTSSEKDSEKKKLTTWYTANI